MGDLETDAVTRAVYSGVMGAICTVGAVTLTPVGAIGALLIKTGRETTSFEDSLALFCCLLSLVGVLMFFARIDLLPNEKE